MAKCHKAWVGPLAHGKGPPAGSSGKQMEKRTIAITDWNSCVWYSPPPPTAHAEQDRRLPVVAGAGRACPEGLDGDAVGGLLPLSYPLGRVVMELRKNFSSSASTGKHKHPQR